MILKILNHFKNFFHFLATIIYTFLYLKPHIIYLFNYNEGLFLFASLFLILGITWYINAFNFMDGIDGITSVQIISICLSLVIIIYFLNKEINVLVFTLLIIIPIFCYFNWSPASIFLGDSGSIPLGFLTIFLLIDLALEGFWLAALILPLYYLMDTGITLLKRIIKAAFWSSQRTFLSKSHQNGFSHSWLVQG